MACVVVVNGHVPLLDGHFPACEGDSGADRNAGAVERGENFDNLALQTC